MERDAGRPQATLQVCRTNLATPWLRVASSMFHGCLQVFKRPLLLCHHLSRAVARLHHHWPCHHRRYQHPDKPADRRIALDLRPLGRKREVRSQEIYSPIENDEAKSLTCHHLLLTMKATKQMRCYVFSDVDKALDACHKSPWLTDLFSDLLMFSSAKIIQFREWSWKSCWKS